MRELIAEYGDRMQPHLVDAIKGTMTDEQITDAMVARKKVAIGPGVSSHLRSAHDADDRMRAVRPNIQGPEQIEGKKADPFQSITFAYQST